MGLLIFWYFDLSVFQPAPVFIGFGDQGVDILAFGSPSFAPFFCVKQKQPVVVNEPYFRIGADLLVQTHGVGAMTAVLRRVFFRLGGE